MILDTIRNAAAYSALGDRLARGLIHVATTDFSTIRDGKYELSGDDVFALVQSYDTKPTGDREFEAHRLYADIQFIASGEEIIFWADVDRLTMTRPYDDSSDAVMFGADRNTLEKALPIHMKPGSFAVFFPQDGHLPAAILSAPTRVRKVVVKVRL